MSRPSRFLWIIKSHSSSYETRTSSAHFFLFFSFLSYFSESIRRRGAGIGRLSDAKSALSLIPTGRPKRVRFIDFLCLSLLLYRMCVFGNFFLNLFIWTQITTGGHIITNLPGITPMKPGSCTLPSFGIDPVILDPVCLTLQAILRGC